MPLDNIRKAGHSRILALGVVVLALMAVLSALKESRRIGLAKDALPPACISELLALSDSDARQHGVSFGECSARKGVTDLKTEIKGRWVYGPAEAPIDGVIVHVWRTLPTPDAGDMLIHVSVAENRLYLNDIFTRGQGCAGSVADAQINDGTFSHAINMTPEAVLLFAPSDAFRARYHAGDVANGAKDCYGKMMFSQRLPVTLQLRADAVGEEKKAEGNHPQQACFDKLIARYIDEGKTELSIGRDYGMFLRAYSVECMGGLPETRAAQPPHDEAPRMKKNKKNK